MSLELKYLKYKQKYLNTKNQLNQLLNQFRMRGGATVSALMIVDPQNDFCKAQGGLPDGSLAVTDSNSIFPHINALHDSFTAKGQTIFISQDWHPQNHVSFASNHVDPSTGKPYGPFNLIDLEAKYDEKTTYKFKQMVWPDHCVQGTRGAEVSPLLKLNGSEIYIRKGTGVGIDAAKNNLVDSYSAFGDEYRGSFEKSPLHGMIAERGINRLVVCGLATDYCVGSTAIDAKLFFPEMDVILIQDCMRGVAPDTTASKVAKMREMGLHIYDTVAEFMASPHAN
jgi:nicotinamidase/pyrazinamidase